MWPVARCESGYTIPVVPSPVFIENSRGLKYLYLNSGFSKVMLLSDCASYELNRSFFIDENDPLHSTRSFRQTAINIPATLLFQSRNRNGFGIYTGVGVNLRYSLNSSLDIPNYSTNKIQWNANAVVGIRNKHLYIEEEIGSQLNDLLKSGVGAPKSKLSTTMLKIGWATRRPG